MTKRHEGICTDFMEAGMRLTDDGIKRVLSETNIKPDSLNFAQLQSAATATELVVQLCVGAIKSTTAEGRRKKEEGRRKNLALSEF
ncbi:MAG: hypothetical protein F6K54_30675 [Okeania sp. SIO3B5]|uniref:hypothetical protein n=1 Tax=Okeania sp. SIO3B5 TaxID=2607811 RepID=UPI00140030DB|nr:hypothetical protein [Okeania sp. SIO3B5]NEO57051.1 hypothetical protein [Okeania sp. SIO3B5]